MQSKHYNVDTLWTLADSSRMIPVVYKFLILQRAEPILVSLNGRNFPMTKSFCGTGTYKHFGKVFSWFNNGKAMPILEV